MLKVLAVANPNDIHEYRYLTALVRSGIKIHLLQRKPGPLDVELPVATHSRWPVSGRRTISKILGSNLGNLLADAAVHRQLRRLWNQTQTQICHVHWIDEKAWHCAIAGLRPLVLTCYGSDLNWTRLPDHDPYLRKQKAEAIARCDLFIADSEDMIALASELAGCELRSLLLPIGIDTQLFRPGYEVEASEWRSELGIPEDATLILSPRLIGPNYRQDTIMKAFCTAVRRGGVDAYIIFKKYLSDKACVDRILAIASEEKMLDRVRIIDAVPYERLSILYSMVDFAVNFPKMDAFPVTFLECCACEVPVISNRLPAYSSNGIAKYLTFVGDNDDYYALSQEIVTKCCSGVDKLLLQEARAHITRRFDESAFGDELVCAYKELLQEGVQSSNVREGVIA